MRVGDIDAVALIDGLTVRDLVRVLVGDGVPVIEPLTDRVGVNDDVMERVGVMEDVSETVGVTEIVTEMVGVIDAVVEIVGVIDALTLMEAVMDRVTDTDDVIDSDGDGDGVGSCRAMIAPLSSPTSNVPSAAIAGDDANTGDVVIAAHTKPPVVPFSA